MKLQIENETVYAVYRDGKPFHGEGCKLIYTTKGAATGVITREAKGEAEGNYYLGRNILTDKHWYELELSIRENMIIDIKRKFSIVEYVPKEKGV